MTIELETDISAKGMSCLKITSALSGSSYSVSTSSPNIPLSSFNDFIYIDDFERYTDSNDLRKYWSESGNSLSLYFSDATFPATVSQNLGDYDSLAFMAKGDPELKFLMYFTDTSSVNSNTLSICGIENKWKKFEYTLSWGTCNTGNIEKFTIKYTGSEIMSKGAYLDEIVLFGIKTNKKNEDWIPINILAINETKASFMSSDGIIGNGDAFSPLTNNENSYNLSIFSPSNRAETDYQFIRKTYFNYDNLLLRYPGGFGSIYIQQMNKIPRHVYSGTASEFRMNIIEDTYRSIGLSPVYYFDTNSEGRP